MLSGNGNPISPRGSEPVPSAAPASAQASPKRRRSAGAKSANPEDSDTSDLCYMSDADTVSMTIDEAIATAEELAANASSMSITPNEAAAAAAAVAVDPNAPTPIAQSNSQPGGWHDNHAELGAVPETDTAAPTALDMSHVDLSTVVRGLFEAADVDRSGYVEVRVWALACVHVGGG